MGKFYLSNKATADLSGIWDYTYNKWSEKQADKYYRLLIDNCKEVSGNPELGKHYPEIANGLYGHKAGQHIIFYIITGNIEISVIRILHSHMDLKNKFRISNNL